MAPESDPYRTLGVARGASPEEIKRAYRRLAKANHPDRAGEAALPRFLAIQAAYDRIVGPDTGIRATGRGGDGSPSWSADPGRAGATHRAYGSRSRRTRPGPGAARGPAAGAAPGPDGSAQDRRPPRPDRPTNRATPGSTSYDGADTEPFEPDWRGASWYGTTSGTYWTLNPKEYADPRKHGPEYQARGRRRTARAADAADPRAASETAGTGPTATNGAAPPGEPAPATGDTPDATPPGTSDARDGGTRRGRPPGPTHTTASWWDATSGSAPGEVRRGPGASADGAWADGTGPGERAAAHAHAAGAPPGPPLTADAVLGALRGWLMDGRPGVIGRLTRAAVGWAPVALGVGWFAGEVSGCGRFAADCDPAVTPLTWLVQVAVLSALLVAPFLARIAAIAAVATLAVSLSGALLLSPTAGGDDPGAGRAALGVLIVIAWAAGIVVAVVREARRSVPTGPVS